MKTPPPHILLVEDNEDDIFIFRRIYRQIGCDYPMHVVRNGTDAIAYLGGTSPYADRKKYPIPKLVFLDLKLPLQPGSDVLAWLREQKELVGLPVVVLTSSAEGRDISRARALRADAYLVKPPKRSALRQVLSELVNPSPVSLRLRVDGDQLDSQK
jgi:CheY-like chemotaxis protein